MSESRERLGDVIRARREACGWTTRELAKRTSLGESTIRKIENSTSNSVPRVTTLVILSSALGLPPNYLSGILAGTQETDIRAQPVDNAMLLSSVAEVRQRLDELHASVRKRQDRHEIISLERHRSLERRLDNLGAMLARLSRSAIGRQNPNAEIKRDRGQQAPT